MLLWGERRFIPTQIPTLRVWYDALRTPTGAVASWTDFSGNGNNATQGTGAAQPVCVANGINGLRSLNFQAKYMSITNVAALVPGNAGLTIFIVSRNNTDSGSEFNLLRKFGNGVTNLGWLINYANNASPDKIAFGISGNGTSGGFATVNQPALTVPSIVEYVGRASTSANSQFILNGTVAATNSAQVYASTSDILIGEGSTNNFDIGEILIFMRELTAAERQMVRRYLSGKWGVVIA